MRYLLPVLALAAAPALAQTQEDRDRGFLVGLIEDNLSAPGLQVRLEGFEGALSSEASLDELTVSDDEGVWLRLEDVILDWNRSALLRGRLEVEALTAGLIEVRRAPLPPEGVEALPDAGAGGFSLPNLPVSVRVDALRADRIELGEPLLGQDLALTLEAAASLADGSGNVTLEARRLDGVEGVFDIAAAYDAETTQLSVDLDVREAEGGIAAGLLGLPGEPAVEVRVAGEGPLDAFSADIALLSDDVERVSGAVTLSGVEAGRRFDVDLGGDLTSLLASEYRPFFGEDVSLRAEGLLRDAGGVVLDALAVDTQALTLAGTAAVGADGWPTLLDVEGQLRSSDGGPVLLPTATEITVAGARFTLRHDAAESEDFLLDLTVDGLSHPAVDVASARILADGVVSRAEGAVDGAVGDLSIEATGLAFDDPGLQQAVGTEVTLAADLDWAPGAPIRVEGLSLRGPALEADGALGYDAAAELPLTLDLTARVPALADLSGLTGQDALRGAVEVTVEGGAALGGAFDLEVQGTAEGLAVGIAQADALLDGTTSLGIVARRDETGTFLDALDLSNPSVQVIGEASILAEDAPQRAEGGTSQASLVAVLADGSGIDPRLAGETRAVLSVTQGEDEAFSGSVRVSAPEGVELQATGVLTGPNGDVDFSLTVPELEPFAPGVPGGLTAEGRAFKDAEGDWRVDAEAAGPYDVTASVIGVVTGERLEVEYEAALPDPTAALPALASVPALAAPVTLTGTLTQQGSVLVTDTRVDAPEGVVLRVAGPVTGDAARIDVALTVPEVQAFAPQVEGSLSLDGTAAKLDGVWTVDADVAGPYGSTATVDTALGDGPLTVDFTLAAPDLSQVAPSVPGGLDIRGTAVQAPEGWQVDVTGTGPYEAALDLAARLPEAGPEVDASIRIPDASAIAGALEGPLTVEAQAVQRDGVWSADLEAAGPFGATATATASLPPEGARVVADVRVPDVSVLDPRLEGPLTVDLNAEQVDGVWEAQLDAAGPLDATADIDARLPEGGVELTADVLIPDGAALDPRLAGPTRLTAEVTRDADGQFRGTANFAAPQDVTLTAEGLLTGPDADVTFALDIPELGAFVEGVPGAVTAEGRAFVDDAGAWTVDAEAAGPYDLTASVEGTVTGERPEIAYEARLPDPTAAVPALESIPALAAPVTLTGTLVQEDGAFVTDTRVDAPEGVVLRLAGPVTGEAPAIDVALTVPAVQAFVPQVEGTLSVDGTVRRQGEDWTAEARATGPYDAVATVEAVLTDTPLMVGFTLALPELSAVVPAVPGGLEIEGSAVQAPEGWQVDVTGTGPYEAMLDIAARLPEAGPEIDADIRIPDASAIAGALEGPLTVEARAVQRDGVWSAELDAAGPFGATATATASLPPDGAEVVADIRVPDVSALDPRLEGPLTVDLDARQVDGVWTADLDAAGPLGATVTADATLGGDGPEIVADVRIPDSSVLAERLEGPLIADLDATQVDGVWTVDFDASGPLGASAVGEARLDGTDAEVDFDLRVPDSSVIAPQLNGPLNADVSARQVDGVWTGTVDSRGPFGGTIEATARLDGGAIDVDATVALPDASRVSPQLQGPVRAVVSARQRDGVWTAEADSTGPFAATLDATARLDGSDADVQASLSLPDVSRIVPQLSGPLNAQVDATQRDGVWNADLDASGPLGASLDVSGVVAGAPVDVAVDLSVPNIAALVPDLPGPLRATGRVAQEGEAYRLDLDVAGPSGTQADVVGTAATDGTLDLSVAGSAPLGLANAFIEPQRVDGTVRFDLRVAGPPALESVTGTVTTQGATLVLPTLRNDLDPLDATITLSGGQANVQASATLGTGGTVQVSGPVGLAAPFDADLAVAFDVTLEDPSLYTAEAEGALRLTGPLTGGAVIAGEIVVPSAEIAVPSTGITAIGDLPPIDHLGATRPVQRTLARAGQDAATLAETEAREAGGGGPGFGLDLVIRAPGRIFVRGRGLDAELGGEIFLSGTTNQVITAGGFELIRGRLDILEQRFLFDEGQITFQGDLVPYVRLVAETETDTLTAFIIVEGPVDDIDVRFESAPEVPQEEILAQIFFGRDLTELSPLQALQLANSVAVLAGRGSGGLLERLRGNAGLDDLDVTTDADGNTAVRAGKYISDNVYTTVQIDQQGDAEISLNLDLTPNLTIRGTTGAAGDSTLGVYFEKDY